MFQKLYDIYYRWSNNLIGGLIYLLIMAIGATLRLKIVGEDNISRAKLDGSSILYAIWHQATFIPSYAFRKNKWAVLTTTMRRGEIISTTARLLGYKTYQIPDEVNSFKSLQNMLEMVRDMKNGLDGVVAVDGPTGPCYKVKPGVFFMAERAGTPLVPVAAAARWAIQLKYRWDHYLVPLPFTKAVIAFGAPEWIKEPLDAKKISKKCGEMEAKLMHLKTEAEQIAKL